MSVDKSDTYKSSNENTLHEDAAHLQNNVKVCEPSDTRLPHRRSWDVPWGYTYFVKRAAAIKIGHSAIPKDRIGSLQCGFPDELEVLAIIENTIIDEPTVHRKFAHLRMSGEWFRAEPELLAFIAILKAEANNMPQRNTPELKNKDLSDARHHLSRLRPHCPPAAQAHVSNLIMQIGNFQENPDRLRPMILQSIERIEAAL